MIVTAAGLTENLDYPVIGWHNLVTRGGVVADTEDPSYPATNLANHSTAAEWRASDSTEQYITVDAADDVDYVAIARHNFGTAGIAVSIEGHTGDVIWDEKIVPFIPADDAPIIMRFVSETLSEVRVKLAAGTAPARAAVLYVGRLLTVERSFTVASPHLPFPFGRTADIIDGASTGGNFLGRIVLGEWQEAAVEFDHMTAAFYRASFDPFLISAIRRPFFFASTPASFPNDVGFAWLMQPPHPAIDPVTGRHSIGLQMRGIA